MGLKVLSKLDAARTQLYHFRAIIIAGMGFFADAYDLFCIPPVSTLLGRRYYKGPLPHGVNSAVNAVALCGTFAGQLFFGWLGDRMGRKKVYGITLILMVASSILSGFSLGSSPKAVITCLCFFRFWLGFGIGGDYPLSATIMSEYANTRTRGAFIAAVFAMQGLGILAASTVVIIVTACFMRAASNPDEDNPEDTDLVWRIILMFGAVPALLTYYFRMQMPETARYTALVARNAKQAAADMSTVLHLDIEENEDDIVKNEAEKPRYGLFSKDFAKRHGRFLLGTTSTWFFIDIAFYSSNLCQKDIYKAVRWLKEWCKYKNPVDEAFHIARAQALIALCATLPGYLCTVLLIDRIGRFPIQLGGFFLLSVFLFAMAAPYESYWLKESNWKGFLAMYSFTFFFSNFGPNTTTFIVPAELFPARLRSTCHGISAAAGKLGAIIGSIGFMYASQPTHKTSLDCDQGYPTGIGVRRALYMLAGASGLGFLFTFLIPETKDRSLEENEDKDAQPEQIIGLATHITENDISGENFQTA